MATALQTGALTPSQTQQTGSKKAVSLIDRAQVKGFRVSNTIDC